MELTQTVSETAHRQESSSNDKGINKHLKEVYLPSKITTSYSNDKDEVKILEFGYDDENRLTSEECTTFEKGKITEKNIFSLLYNANGALIQYTAKWQEIGMGEVIYEEDNVVDLSHSDLQVTAINKEQGNKNILTLDTNARILKNEHISEYYSKSDTYSYDKTGNLVKKETSNNGEHEEGKRTSYKYDKKNGIFKDLKIEPWISTLFENGYETLFINNVIEVTSCYSPYKEVNNYEYRKDDFPSSYTSKRVYEESENDISSTVIEYIKK